MLSSARMIVDDTEIAALVATLQHSPWLALDTEADSLHAYPEKLCLIQISHSGGDVLVDPLSPASLTPLLAHLSTRELILHGADFDLRLLRRTRGFVASRSSTPRSRPSCSVARATDCVTSSASSSASNYKKAPSAPTGPAAPSARRCSHMPSMTPAT